MMGQLPPFEEREAYGGFFPALWQTWLAACFRPAKFFESVGNSQNLTPALFFGVLVGWVGFFALGLWLVLLFPMDGGVSVLMGKEEVAKEVVFGVVFWVVLWGLLGWLIVLLRIVLWGFLFHLFPRRVGSEIAATVGRCPLGGGGILPSGRVAFCLVRGCGDV